VTKALPVYPFDEERCIGTVSELGPSYARANFPDATLTSSKWHYGRRLGAGEVGEFVIIECGDVGIFGRITTIKLPEKERLTVEPRFGIDRDAHPLGTIQLMTTIPLKGGRVSGGISEYPRLGARVYSAHPELVRWLAEGTMASGDRPNTLVLNLASLPSMDDTRINLPPESLFGRHCAILGATGGGKSWTIARLVEQTARHHAKVILFDATGEFHTLASDVQHVHVGTDASGVEASAEVVVPYSELTEADLFALFKPSGQTQAPKLRAAMKSLKLARLAAALANPSGVIVKVGKPKATYDAAYTTHAHSIENPKADFDVAKLAQQINEECVYLTGFSGGTPDPTRWGNVNDSERSYCVTLITRIEDMLQSSELACVFQPFGKTSIFDELQRFLVDPNNRVLRISLRHLPFAHNAREIVANAIGRYLLALARAGQFRERPLLIFLDEAHQFLDKTLGDENTRYLLDSFELIAKEGRKFSLNICIATQRPRDIPEGVLSQMGTLIVHRLTNDRDREVVERASGEIDRSAAAFLPILAEGQAVIIGVDFPIPLTIQITKPDREPDSRGPDYQKDWRLPSPPDRSAHRA
jgi:DNA helicase HerA-like ATPase